ncbi:MAG: hypothetical protein MUF71_22100 [Candidatus Kapabacteria bacterium]|nr:hypothetical protein [Candidatus Kapabacteria bacterium]
MCISTFAPKFGASRLTPTELVASGDGKAVGLRSGGCGLYWLCPVFDRSTHFLSRARAESSAVYRSNACVRKALGRFICRGIKN